MHAAPVESERRAQIGAQCDRPLSQIVAPGAPRDLRPARWERSMSDKFAPKQTTGLAHHISAWVLAWCVTWPIGSAIPEPVFTLAICFLGWPALALFMIWFTTR